MPACLQSAVRDALRTGAPLLLPPLRERMEILHSLLPQGPGSGAKLTVGQVGQLTGHCWDWQGGS